MAKGVKISAKAVSKIYYNEGNGYSIVEYQTTEELPKELPRSGLFTAIGTELPADSGVEVELRGSWIEQAKYGLQLKVDYYQIIIPESLEGIKAYLSSNLMKGIGPVTAERIVEKFGLETFAVIDKTPNKLLEIRGITPSKLDEIIDGYNQSVNIRQLMTYLAPKGISANKIMKIQDHFKGSAYKIVKEQPYRLCEIRGFGFLTVDPIAIRSANFQYDDPLRIKAAIIHVLESAENSGHLFLTSDQLVQNTYKLLNHKKEDDDTIVTNKQIGTIGNQMILNDKTIISNMKGIYLKKNYEAEMGGAISLAKLSLQDKMCVDISNVLKEIEKEENLALSKMQREAIITAFQNPGSVITGGPGSGKTTIIRILVKVQERLNRDSMILLCAATGRAARKMYEATHYASMTIHKALGLIVDEPEWNDLEQMPDDLIIVDESSMLDMFLADKLFKSIKPGARLVLVGDVDQIESVAAGNVFKEVIDSEILPVTYLDESFRTEEGSVIYRNAQKILSNRLDLTYDDDFKFINAKDATAAAEMIKRIYHEIYKNNKTTDGVQVLTPLRKDTDAGAEALNLLLRDIANPKRQRLPEVKNGSITYRLNDKVMQTKNADEVNNGDIGKIISINKREGKTVMRVDFGEDRIMDYSGNEIWPLTHAYSMTVHKAQGSEYPIIIIPMVNAFYRMLRRNILYTAITRAQSKVIIVGSKSAIAQAIRNNTTDVRNTKFAKRLKMVRDAIREELNKKSDTQAA